MQGNHIQVAERGSGKIAKAPARPDFEGIEDILEFVEPGRKKHDIEPDIAVIDLRTGRRIFTGTTRA